MDRLAELEALEVEGELTAKQLEELIGIRKRALAVAYCKEFNEAAKANPKLGEAIMAYQEGATISDAAAIAKISPPTFTQRLKENGVAIRPPGRRPDNRRRTYAVLLHRAGYPVAKIVYATASSYLTVRSWLQVGGCDLSQRRMDVPRHLVTPPPQFDTLPAEWMPDNLIDHQWAGSPTTLGLDGAWAE